jgi:predicted Zn-dependent protease
MKRVGLLLVVLGLLSSCDKNNNLTLFSIQNDLELGLEVKRQIEADPQYLILSSSDYPQAYSYLDSITNVILNTSAIAYRDEFAWEVSIIQDDEVLNAFATPGGYIYVYTGLIKYLKDADAFAGVLGHEIAHADLRHTSRNLQRSYGISFLLQLITGNNQSELQQIAAQIAGTAAGLSFSREFESESDAKSVDYLAQTAYACDGAKLFFQQLEAAGQGTDVPQFLSTHPSPENRIEMIEQKASELNCNVDLSGEQAYLDFQNALP